MELRHQVWAQGSEIFFFADFNTQTVNELVRLIDKNKSKKDLRINIKSYGGYTDEMWAAVDLIRRHDVRVHVVGYAMSAGFGLFCAAKNRTMEPSAVLMYHQSSYGESGTVEDHRRRLKLVERRNDDYRQLAVDTGAFTHEELQAYDDKNEDFYIFYQDAIDRKLVSEMPASMKRGMEVGQLEVE